MKLHKSITIILFLLKPFSVFSNEEISKESLIKEIILKKKSLIIKESLFLMSISLKTILMKLKTRVILVSATISYILQFMKQLNLKN